MENCKLLSNNNTKFTALLNLIKMIKCKSIHIEKTKHTILVMTLKMLTFDL